MNKREAKRAVCGIIAALMEQSTDGAEVDDLEDEALMEAAWEELTQEMLRRSEHRKRPPFWLR